MYKRRRYPLLFALLILAAVAAGAETLAVSVRLVSGPEDEPGLIPLLATIEEGVMEAMFAQGHIVFDIDDGGVSDEATDQALGAARDGGSAFLVLVDVVFEIAPGRGLVPPVTEVTVIDIDSELDRPAGTVDLGSLAGSEVSPPDLLALNVGTAAAELALSEIGEAGTSW